MGIMVQLPWVQVLQLFRLFKRNYVSGKITRSNIIEIQQKMLS